MGGGEQNYFSSNPGARLSPDCPAKAENNCPRNTNSISLVRGVSGTGVADGAGLGNLPRGPVPHLSNVGGQHTAPRRSHQDGGSMSSGLSGPSELASPAPGSQMPFSCSNWFSRWPFGSFYHPLQVAVPGGFRRGCRRPRRIGSTAAGLPVGPGAVRLLKLGISLRSMATVARGS